MIQVMSPKLNILRSSIYITLYFIVFSIFTSYANIAHSRTTADGLELTAENISRDYETRTLSLEGQVRIGFGGESITCEKAIINMKNQTISAEGNVVLESPETYIEGEKIIYNYKTKVGEITKGLVQAGQVIFIGDLIKKNSATKFLAKSATYTSCSTCPAAWSFSGYEIEAEIGGYAYIKYPVLRIVDFPVLILPRILVPLKSKRQSGVLVPSLDYSSVGGTAITLPYFWAIDPSQDLTYSLKNYEKRGLKHLGEYRYVLSPGSSGALSGAYLRDEAFSTAGQSSGINDTFSRGFLSYQHFYELPQNYIHRANINLASDLRYPRDFSDEMTGHGDPALENKTSLTKNLNTQHFSVEAAHYTNLLKEDAHSSNNDAVHRFPEINYNLMNQEFLNTNLFFKFDFNYTNFSRRNFAYDDVTSGGDHEPTDVRDGVFDYNTGTGQKDRIRTGHRYIFQPSLSYPFHLGRYLDVNPSVTYNETQYRFNVDPAASIDTYSRNAERRYLQTDISLKTKYSAVFGLEDGVSNRYKHEFEPEVIYSRIPLAKRPDHIFFGNFKDQPNYRHNEPVSNSDFSGDSSLQFDYRDRLFDKNLATFVFSNYLIRKSYLGGLPFYQKFVTFRLNQSYDFNEARDEDPRAWSSINGLLDIRQKNFETHTTADYYPYAKTTNWTTRLRFISELNNFLELSYSKNAIVNEDQVSTSQKNETASTGLGFKAKYLDLVGQANFSLITELLESWEYKAIIKPLGDCWTFNFSQKRTLGSDTLYNLSLDFQFGGI